MSGDGEGSWWSKTTPGGRTLLIVVAALVALGVTGSLLGDDESEGDGNQQYAAFDACKRFVAARLKAPATAKWRDPAGDQVSYRNEGADSFAVLIIRASVDSENGFGALIRSTYTCTVRDLGDQWELVDLQIREP